MTLKCIRATTTLANQEQCLTSGAYQSFYISFEFDSSWDGLEKYAEFNCGDKVGKFKFASPFERKLIIKNGTYSTDIPYEVLQEDGFNVYVSVYGCNADGVRLSTVWTYLGIVRLGSTRGAEGELPPGYDSNATAETILQGYSGYVKGKRVDGTIPIVDGKTLTVSEQDSVAIAGGSYAKADIIIKGVPVFNNEYEHADDAAGATEIPSGDSVVFKTAGKYCPKDISVSASKHWLVDFMNGTKTEITANDLQGITLRRGALAFSPITSLEIEQEEIPKGLCEECRYLKTITLLEGVKTIGENAFMWCDFASEISLPQSLKSIGQTAFNNTRSLQEIVIPDGVTDILGVNNFMYCGIKKATIGAGISKLGQAFNTAQYLKTVILRGDTLKALTSGACFGKTPFASGDGTFYIQPTSENVDVQALIAEYETATNWTVYAGHFKPYSEYVEE